MMASRFILAMLPKPEASPLIVLSTDRMPLRPLLPILGITLLLGACGTVTRAPDLALRSIATPLAPAADPRLAPTEPIRPPSLSCAEPRPCARAHPPILLALSGGGANGAYGAGVLIGWTERGDRPEFDIVTGVSTGALSAPFAFLGDDWNDQLANAYLGARTSGILSWRSFAAFALPGLFSPRTLEGLIEENVTPDLLRAVADEHRRGRRLYVGTTNLDDGQPVIWDMGLIATQGDANALTLFRQVLMASASIPGVFPPVLIAGLDDDGVVRQQMHVDGAVTAAFIGVPVGTMLDAAATADWSGAELYVIVNGRIAVLKHRTPGGIRAIAERSIAVTGAAALTANLQNQAIFADMAGATLAVAAIPHDADPADLRFDRNQMANLMQKGRDLARDGRAFTSFSRSMAEAPTQPTGAAPEPAEAVEETDRNEPLPVVEGEASVAEVGAASSIPED